MSEQVGFRRHPGLGVPTGLIFAQHSQCPRHLASESSGSRFLQLRRTRGVGRGLCAFMLADEWQLS